MAAVFSLPAAAGELERAGRNSVALFEGKVIDLATGWGEAQACVVLTTETPVECFRSESELLARGSGSAAALTSTAVTASSTCSSSVRLYDGVSYTGAVLYLYQRSAWINLADYGFADRTSSFKIGACSSYFADYANGGGSWYPTSATQAWDVASSMASGWNNRVSSIYIS
jgi:hypothetical protein